MSATARRRAGIGGGASGGPVNTVAPAVTGSTTVGSTLTSTNGTWTNSPTSYTYQWYRSGTVIAGATASTHVIVTGDQGFTLSCTVTAINAAGSAYMSSNGVGIPGGAPGTLIQATSSFVSSPPATSPVSTNFTYPVTAGNLMVCCYSWSDNLNRDCMGVTDTLGSTWTRVNYGGGTFVLYNSSLGFCAGMAWAVVPSGGGANAVTVTEGNTGGGLPNSRIWLEEFAGVTALDVSSGAVGNSGSLNSGSATITHATDLLWGMLLNNSGGLAAGSSGGVALTMHNPCQLEYTTYGVTASVGSYATVGTGTSSEWICLMGAFHP